MTYPAFPTPFTVIHIPIGGVTENVLGNTVRGFGAPVELAVIAIAPHKVRMLWSPIEQGQVGTMANIDKASLDMYTPPASIALNDRIALDGEILVGADSGDPDVGWWFVADDDETYGVTGDLFQVNDVKDWTKGFHGWKPGLTVALEKYDG